jgi:hypothetical protein
VAREHRHPQHQSTVDYTEQQVELASHKGRSLAHHECALLLTLLIGIVLHYGEIPTSALRFL